MRSLWNLHDTLNVFAAAQKVLEISNLEIDIRNEAMMIKAKSALTLGKDSIAISTLNQIVKESRTEASSEARFIIANKAFLAGDYNKAESIVYDIIQQDPSYEYWVAKALVLSADIFMKTDNEHQAVATLQSIISNYHGDKALIEEAKGKLEAINLKNSKNIKEPNKEDDLIINLDKGDEKNTQQNGKDLKEENLILEEIKN